MRKGAVDVGERFIELKASGQSVVVKVSKVALATTFLSLRINLHRCSGVFFHSRYPPFFQRCGSLFYNSTRPGCLWVYSPGLLYRREGTHSASVYQGSWMYVQARLQGTRTTFKVRAQSVATKMLANTQTKHSVSPTNASQNTVCNQPSSNPPVPVLVTFLNRPSTPTPNKHPAPPPPLFPTLACTPSTTTRLPGRSVTTTRKKKLKKLKNEKETTYLIQKP